METLARPGSDRGALFRGESHSLWIGLANSNQAILMRVCRLSRSESTVHSESHGGAQARRRTRRAGNDCVPGTQFRNRCQLESDGSESKPETGLRLLPEPQVCRFSILCDDCCRISASGDCVDPMAVVLANQKSTQAGCDFRNKIVSIQFRSMGSNLPNLLENRRREAIPSAACPDDSTNDPPQSHTKVSLTFAGSLIIALKRCGTKLTDFLSELSSHYDS